MNNFFKYRAYVLLAILVGGGVFLGGMYYGQRNTVKIPSSLANTSGNANVDFATFWKAWEVINEKYVPTNSTTTEKVSDQTRVYGAIEGMVHSLGDPYTMFFPPAESKSFNEEISGQIEGVGMEVGMKDDILTVIAPVKGTPAYRAGVKSGDKILKIDSTHTGGLSTEEAIKLIRGKKGSTVVITFFREGTKDPFEISIVRDVINMPTVDTETKGEVAIIRLYSFSAISPNLFRDAVRDAWEKGQNKMIIDLRGNPGGYLEAAIDMASWFLPSGKVIVKEDFRDEKDAQVFRSKGYDIFDHDTLKMVILIDGGSASASEILAGALHDQGVATLVGVQSFGKGSVQELIPITSDTSLKVTIAKWLTPNGISISHQGLTPDVIIKLDETKFLKEHIDNQMEKALEIVNK